ncbi:hypothetical protein ACFWOG_05235 [Kitasatospora sp. NPDC058406]|uniref:hypothetical protein n=1 Tax=Kitasatospora sp. NPDC058406 TaxID=3346483 RepID=UPI0036652508
MARHRLSRRRRITLAATALAAGSALILAPRDAPAAATATDPVGLNAAHAYLGWGDAPDPVAVMKATGLRQFALSYVLAGGSGCEPRWDGSRPLTGGSDEAAIKRIRAAGGEVLAAFGGWDGAKLGERCGTAAELAAAYQKVVDAYALKAVDIDVESTELTDPAVRRRIVEALRTLKAKNPGLLVYVTFQTEQKGPDADGTDLIALAAKSGLVVDGWTALPFDFAGRESDLPAVVRQSVTGLQRAVATAYGWADDQAWRHVGLVAMNGRTDQQGEQLTVAGLRTVREFAATHHLARLGLWAVNRDRPCPADAPAGPTCSGVKQSAYDFTRVVAGYHTDSVPGDVGGPCRIPLPSIPPLAVPSGSASGSASNSPAAGRSVCPTPTATVTPTPTPTPTATSTPTSGGSPSGTPSASPTSASPTSAAPVPGSAVPPAVPPATTVAAPVPGAGADTPGPVAVAAPAPAPAPGGSLAATGASGVTDTLLTTSGALLFLGGAIGLVGTRRRDPEGTPAGGPTPPSAA